jgi:hypothetical protein
MWVCAYYVTKFDPEFQKKLTKIMKIFFMPGTRKDQEGSGTRKDQEGSGTKKYF